MQEVDINTLINKDNELNENIPNNIIIIGNIDELIIENKYDHLDLSRIECNSIWYVNQEGESIKNHILPNSLEELYCSDNELTSLSNLPNSLQYLDCENNELTSLPQIPYSLTTLKCSYNKLTSLNNSQLPNGLIKLECDENKLT